MGWLVGLPLGLFRMLFMLVRFLLPLLILIVILFLLRRFLLRRSGGQADGTSPKEPKFHGPVYTVDYEEVKEEPRDGEAPKEDDGTTWN